jgi:hypothetical protein
MATREWLGDRPAGSVSCNGTPCSLIELDDRLAASWQRGERRFTAVGLHDVAELTNLVAWFDDRKQIGAP